MMHTLVIQLRLLGVSTVVSVVMGVSKPTLTEISTKLSRDVHIIVVKMH